MSYFDLQRAHRGRRRQHPAMGPILRIEASCATRLRNQDDRPTTIPHTLEDLLIEQAVAREALAPGVRPPQVAGTGLKGSSRRGRSGRRCPVRDGETLVICWRGYDRGHWRRAHHAPLRQQAALIDAGRPTNRKVSRCWPWTASSLMPQWHPSTVQPGSCDQVFERDCLISLGERRRTRGECEGRGDDRDGRVFRGMEIPCGLGRSRCCPWRTASWRRSRSSPARGFNGRRRAVVDRRR